MIKYDYPEPIIGEIDVLPFKKKMDPAIAIEALIEGDFVVILDNYSTGLILLKALKEYLKNKHSDESYKQQRDYRAVYNKLSNNILVLINKHKLEVKKSPDIGWFKLFYSELDEFLLPFPKVQGLNSAWQWYQKGISIPVLEHEIYPFYGTYFPTRFEHLTLFDDWLKKYTGNKSVAIDVGIGSGVLAYQMLKYGFEKIIGTDINPNAIHGLNIDVKNKERITKFELHFGNLFANYEGQVDLIIFNPPWIPAANYSKGIDEAIYYSKDLFSKFFEEAKNRLNSNGRIVLLFSNLAQVTGVCEKNPIEEELIKSNDFELDVLIEATVNKASKKTRRNQNWREKEKVQMWVLKLK